MEKYRNIKLVILALLTGVIIVNLYEIIIDKMNYCNFSLENQKAVNDNNPYIEMKIFNNFDPLVQDLKQVLDQSFNSPVVLDATLNNIDGMSGKRFRFFLNNLINKVTNPRYLEIGVWKGSTFCSAIFNNKVQATAIDNFSQFGGPIKEFKSNLAKCISGSSKVTLFNRDYKDINYKSLPYKFNIYFFDGPHEYKDQSNALLTVKDALEDKFIFIVDDYNWDIVRKGTIEAMKNYKILFTFEIRTTLNGSFAGLGPRGTNYHNGYLIAILQKKYS